MASGGSDRNMSEETFDYICTACADADVIKEGIKYCVECKGYCCKDCVSLHATYLPLKQHSLLDISTSQQADQTSKLLSFPTERCSIHQGKIIDMYCGNHNTVGCYACIATTHLNCKDIHSIPEDVDKITKFEEFDQNSRDLQAMAERVQSMLNKSNEIFLKNLEDSRQHSLLAITKQRREINTILDRLEEKAKADVETTYNQLRSELVSLNERMESCLIKFNNLAERNRRAKGNKSQKFVCTKLSSAPVIDGLHDIDDIEKELGPFKRHHALSFVADNSLVDFLQELDKFGHLRVKDASALYKIRRSEDITVKIPSDTMDCNIMCCCLFDENKLIITDNYNRKLKRVDIVNVSSVVDCIDLPYDICGVCCVKNNEVAVACCVENMIQFVSVGKTMKPSRQLKLNHQCFHVAYMDNKLYVSDDGGSVHIYDMMGTLLHTTSTDSSGNKLCQYSGQTALCANEDYMCVGGFDGLMYLDRTGNHITTVIDSDIACSEGVCIDGSGNVFAASLSTNKIVQFRYDGTKVGVIVNNVNKRPLSLCFHRQLCKLFVTWLRDDRIKMFDLE